MITENNLEQEVDLLVQEVKRTHRYSMSRIYALYNKVFGTQEQPQSCASCLIRKVRQLDKWLEDRKGAQPETDSKTQPKTKRSKKKQ